MGQADGAAATVGEINRRAVGDVNTEGQSARVRDQRVDARVMTGPACDGRLSPVDLLRRGQRGGETAMDKQRFVFRGKAPQCRLTVGIDVDARQARDERGTDPVHFPQRHELGPAHRGFSD
jgi:hypothetical protein